MATPVDPSPREQLLQRRLTRARFALGALGMLVAVCLIGVGVTIWYWLSYLRGPSGTAFTRGPYLLRVSGSEAVLRWKARGDSDVKVTATAPGGGAVDVTGGILLGLRPDSRYAWVASVDGTAEAGGSFTTPPAALDRPVRFAVLGDYGSGDDDEWAVGRLLAAQRPDFAVTAGDNSYLVAAGPLLDRNIFRPLADLMANAPMYVCLGDHDKFFPGPAALSKAFDLPPGGGRHTVHWGPIQVVIVGDEPNEPEAIAFARKELRQRGPSVRFLVCHRPLQSGDPILPLLRASHATVFSGHLHRYERRTVDGVQTFTVGTGGQGPGSREHTKRSPGSAVSLLDIGALMVDVRIGGVGYTFLDKRGRVLDHVVI
jgi:Calcineurin-like phosphoesterase